MVTLNAHFDGKVIVPDEPLNLPANQKLRIQVEAIEPNSTLTPTPPKPNRILGQQPGAVTFLAPDWDAPLPDDIWDHNKDDQSQP